MKNIGMFVKILALLVIVLVLFFAAKMGTTSKSIIRGKVVLDSSLIEAAQGIKVLYISIRDVSAPFPPYAAFRKSLSGPIGENVYDFILTDESVQKMQPNLPWPQKMIVKARLDRDGIGGMDQENDLIGVVENISRGDNNLVIKINKKVM